MVTRSSLAQDDACGMPVAARIVGGQDAKLGQVNKETDLMFVIFSPQMYFLGSIFLHMKVCKLWQNLPKFPKIYPHDNFFSTI